MQVYRGLEIITNKHPMDERMGIPHHVMNHVQWNEEYFIHRFSKEANAAIDDIHSRGKVPIVIGGTHYYLQNLLFNNKTIAQSPEGSEEGKGEIQLSGDQLEILNGPVEILFETLKNIDPVISEKFHPQDKRKLRRALEIYYKTGEKPSTIYHEQKIEELGESSLKYNTLLFWVYSDPDVLKERLDKRVDSMMELGAQTEIEEMYDFFEKLDPKPDCSSGIWQVIGFKEFLPWLEDGKSQKLLFDNGVERMKIRTRQYAKYQVKWIRKLLSVELQKESRFGFKYGGKMYLLDASDLSKWQENVGKIGIKIAEQFLSNGPKSVTEPQAPEHLKELIPGQDFFENFSSNKVLGSESNWKHYECPVCKDKEGKPLIAVGEESWKIHETSRRHKKLVSAGEKKRKHEEMMLKYNKRKDIESAEEN